MCYHNNYIFSSAITTLRQATLSTTKHIKSGWKLSYWKERQVSLAAVRRNITYYVIMINHNDLNPGQLCILCVVQFCGAARLDIGFYATGESLLQADAK